MEPIWELIIGEYRGFYDVDEEQLQLGSSDKFWKIVKKWRKEKTINRAELEKRLESSR